MKMYYLYAPSFIVHIKCTKNVGTRFLLKVHKGESESNIAALLDSMDCPIGLD